MTAGQLAFEPAMLEPTGTHDAPGPGLGEED